MFWPIVRFLLRVRGRTARALTLKTVGVRALAVDGAGRVLLLRHTYRDGWHFPGGAVDADEHPSDAAAREFREETGGEVLSEPVWVGHYHHIHNHADDHVVLYKFEARADKPHSDSEIAEIAWFAPDDLPADVTPATKRRIDEVFHGGPSDKKWNDKLS